MPPNTPKSPVGPAAVAVDPATIAVEPATIAVDPADGEVARKDRPFGAADAPFLAEGGVTGALVRSIDWGATAVGPVSAWPRSLISTVGMVLRSRHPMFLWWGRELTQFYNDAYMPSFGSGKHPAAMGQAGRACWKEIWPIIGPQIDDVMQHGKASWNEDALVPIFRNGRIEEVYWTYGYSPVFDDSGHIGGTIVVCSETTSRVLASRRARFLRQFSEAISACETLEHILEVTRRQCAAEDLDIPCLLICRRDPTTSRTRIIASTHVAEPVLAALDTVITDVIDTRRVDASAETVFKKGLVCPVQIATLASAWPEPVTEVVLHEVGAEVLVFGVSPRLSLDASYRELFAQIVEQIEFTLGQIETFRVRAAVESERRNLLLQAPVGTALLTGPNHVFELANSRYKEMIGGREVVGKAYLEAFPELAGTTLQAVLDRVYTTGEPFVTHEYLVRLDRTRTGVLEDAYYRFNLEPLRTTEGVVYGMMAVAVDVTEQVKSRGILEKAALERERLLTQLASANQAKDEFLATVSHELRTPLQSILGWSRILGETSDPTRLQKGLSVIERNARAQAQLIEDILDVSRIISGKVRINPRQVDPAAIVNAAVEIVRPVASAKRVRLEVQVSRDLGTIVGDEDRLQQVVWNLLSNAVKFTPPEGLVQIRVTRDTPWLVIAVQDSGRGISPDFLPHVFDRFRQDDTSTTKQQAGLGLGLSIVRHLVEMHAGQVVAHSEGDGHGATFEVKLPLHAVDAIETGSRSLRASEPTHDGPLDTDDRLFGVHVLLVDDQPDVRDLIATVLEDAGALVTQASSVAEAMTVLKAAEIHVLVSDIGMPGQDGYSLIQGVRVMPEPAGAKDIPALALTAYARNEDRQLALKAGFQDHVSKPVDPARLIDLVGSLAGRHPPRENG